MKTYVVRVVQTFEEKNLCGNEGGEISDAFLEALRYAGLITVHKTDQYGHTKNCFDLIPPKYITDTKGWAERNSERMRTFGFNAVCAPSTT